MNDPAPPPSPVTPSLSPADAPVPLRPAPTDPAPRRRSRLLGLFASTLLRRPGRTAAVAALAVLIAAGAWMLGVQAWGHLQLQATRSDVDRYHNRQARERLEGYLRVWPSDPTALLLAARIARRLGTFSEAENFLDRYEAVRGKDDGDLILERVLLQAQRGHVDQVGAFCEARIRENHPSAPLVLEAQAAGLMREFRLAEAEDRLQAWLKLRPDDCQALLLRGSLLGLRQAPEAADDYRRVIELDPDNEEARLRLGTQLLQAHKPTEALSHLEYLRKALPDDPRVLVRVAQCRVDMGRADEARAILDGVLARWPHFPDALAARGALAKQDGQPDRAEGWLREAVARDPSAREARYHLYLCLEAEGKEAEAKEEKARLDRLEDNLNEIQQLVDGGLERAPNDPALHTRAGVLALEVGEAAEGVRWLESGAGDRPALRAGAPGPGRVLSRDGRTWPGGATRGRGQGAG